MSRSKAEQRAAERRRAREAKRKELENTMAIRVDQISFEPEPKTRDPRQGSGRNPNTYTKVNFAAPAKPAGPPPITWDDVCGLTDAKAAMREAIELPIKHADTYRRFGRKPPKGVLLHGPPGNGKTMLAKAAATSVAAMHGAAPRAPRAPRAPAESDDPFTALHRQMFGNPREASARGFIPVSAPELKDSYLGGTERKIRELFDEAKRFKRASGFPAVVFIDEADAILHARNGSFQDSFVNQFLTLMDGVDGDDSAIIILATNRAESLDQAVVRDGRIDRRIYVGPPTRADAEAIFIRLLDKRPLAGTVDDVVAAAIAALYDPRHVLYRLDFADGGRRYVTLGDVTSGAQVAGIVERATSRAIARVIAGGPEGISADDFVAEVACTCDESRTTLHADALHAIADGRQLTDCVRVKAGAVAFVPTSGPVVITNHVGQA